jgi:hypothetical protein
MTIYYSVIFLYWTRTIYIFRKNFKLKNIISHNNAHMKKIIIFILKNLDFSNQKPNFDLKVLHQTIY